MSEEISGEQRDNKCHCHCKLKDDIASYIQEVIQSLPEEDKSSIAEFIAVQATIWGSFNTYEGIGVLEAAKLSYVRTCEEVFMEENNEGV